MGRAARHLLTPSHPAGVTQPAPRNYESEKKVAKSGITTTEKLINVGMDKEVRSQCDRCGKTKVYRVVSSVSRRLGEAWEARHGDDCRR